MSNIVPAELPDPDPDSPRAESAPSPKTLTKQEKIILFFLPNVGDIIFLFLIQIPLFLRPTYVFGDGSTGWHLTTGQWILQNHAVPYKDLISYTHPDAPWVAYEWLSDVLMALAVQLGGLNLLAVCVSCAVGWLIVLLYGRCRQEGAHFLFAAFLCLICTMLSAVHWLARPLIFTFYGVYFFSTRLEDFYRGKISRPAFLLPLALYMLLWVNTHPAFLIGFVLLAIYFASAICSTLYFMGSGRQKHYFETAKWIGVAILCCAVVALINPYGPQLFVYISEYLKGSSVLAATDEFQSPKFHGAFQPACLEVLFALLVTGLAITRKRLTMPKLLTCIAFGHLTLSAVRNMPLFAFVALPAVAQLFSKVTFNDASLVPATVPATETADPTATESKTHGPGNIWARFGSVWNKASAGFDENESLCNSHFWPIATFIALVVISMSGGKFMGSDCLNCTWSKEDKPIETLAYLQAQEKSGKLDPNRGFNFDNWGGYLRYQLGTRVFIDDRADFYGEKFYNEFGRVSLVQPGWQDVLDQYKIQWILMPKNSTLVAALRQSPSWQSAAEDQCSSLFVRK